ncbi:MAG: hypothetical protein AAGE03_10185 [Pseudomonadota bacterium]
MQPHDLTDWHRADLQARMARARADLEAEVAAARVPTASSADETESDVDVQLWNRMGRYAMFFCIWAAMIMPILLILSFRF